MGEHGLRRFFFLHVMKTGGTTFWWRVRNNFAPNELYPNQEDKDLFLASTNVPYLASLPAARRASLRFYSGHFPFVAVDSLGADFVTLTILRDPIERTLSFLRQKKHREERHHADTLEDIYADELVYKMFIRDHQAKLFSFTSDDKPRSFMRILDVDEDRLALAKENLRSVDVIGITERHDEFMSEVSQRFGWNVRDAENMRVSEDSQEVSQAFRDRIAADNVMDIRFYEFARDLCAERQRHALESS